MSTYRWYGIAALIAAVLIAAALIYRSGTAPSYKPPAAEPPGRGIVGNAKLDTDPYDVLITYTDDGFSPRDVTIEQGQRVRFLNSSSAAFWPASGVHPTHTLYPEKESTDCLGSSFDSCQDVAPGEYFDFTFYYEGAWPFHDHSHAYHSGTVTVVAR
jgi:hypothetical protein